MESLLEGTWGGEGIDAEVINAILMHEYKWSEADLTATTWLRRKVCWDYLQAKWQAESDREDRIARQRKQQGG